MTNAKYHKIRTLFVQHASSIGGASWCALEILRHIDRNKIEPFVCLIEKGPLIDAVKALGVTVHVERRLPLFPVYDDGAGLWGLLRLLKRFLLASLRRSEFVRLCKEVQPDVVFLNSLALLFLAKPAKKAGTPMVVLYNREHWAPRRLRAIRGFVKNRICSKYVDRILHITNCGIEQLGFPGRSEVIRDWPSFDDQSDIDVRSELGITAGRIVILVPGGMHPMKGTEDILRALPLMRRRSDVEIIILAAHVVSTSRFRMFVKRRLGKNIVAEGICARAKRLPNVHLHPHTLCVKAFMKASDIVMCPFRGPHAAKAALEAQSLGLPVIAYDNDEAREYVKHNETGIIVPSGNIEELARAMDCLCDHPEIREEYGMNGCKFIAKSFSKDMSIERIEDVLCERQLSDE